MKPPLLVPAALCLALAALQSTPAQPKPELPAPGQQLDKPAAVSLRELSVSLQSLSTRVAPSVVQIFATGYAAAEEGEGSNASLLSKQHSTGSGVIVSADGFIVTNSHVVRGAPRVQVRLPAAREELAGRRSILRPEGRLLDAKVVGQDRESDLAVVKVERAGLAHLELGDSDRLRQGELVMAFGNPLGLEGSVSMGIVSSTARQIKPDDAMIYIQTDAPINPGNSGGPLIDSEGRVVGINTFILTQSGGSEGIGFAIPSNIVKTVYTQIRKEGHVHRGKIGLYAQTITPVIAAGLNLPRDWGVLVADVAPEGPADASGIEVGDIVLSLNGKPMENARQFEVDLYRYPMHEKVHLQLLRDGKDKLDVDVPVIETADDPQRFADLVTPEENLVPRLGILGIGIDKKLSEMLPELRNPYGVVVAGGSPSDVTSGTGLQPGDVIYNVNGSTVTSVAALKRKLDQFKPGDAIVVQIERSGRLMYVPIEIE